MLNPAKDHKKVREEFLKELDDHSDNELLKEIVANQHFQLEIADKT